MEQNKQQFPSEEVVLPSKGLLYPIDSPLSKGIIEIKYMTAKEEDILTNQNYLNNGTVIDKLLQSLIITSIDYNELLIGDKNAILIAARILGYGKDYDFKWKNQNVSVDLTSLKEKELNEKLVTKGKNDFSFTLPIAKKTLTFKMLTHADEIKISKEIEGLQKFDKNSSAEITTRLKHQILSIDGNYENKDIRDFIDTQFLARDSRSFRNHTNSIQADVDLTVNIKMPDGTYEEDVNLPIGVGFFWPDAGI